MSIVVNAPNGNIGRPLTQLLLKSGKAVTIISRRPGSVKDLTEQGARLIEGSFEDAAVLKAAFEGAEALFWLSPPAMRPDSLEYTQSLGERAARLAKEAGVKRVVVLSSTGAHSTGGTGPVAALLPVEDRFRAQLPNVVALRPGFFMENLFRDLDTLKATGTLFAVVPGDQAIPMVATRDIALKAGSYLLSTGWSGHIIEGVHGPADVSYGEVADALSEALGQPVRYQQITVDQAKGAMGEAGLPPFAVALYGDMYQGMVDGRMDPAEPRTPGSTTWTPISQWIDETFRPAYNA